VVAIEHLDDDGNTVPFSDGLSPETVSWQAYAPQGTHARRGWVEPKHGFIWPTVSTAALGRVRVRYTAGYADTVDTLPDLVKAAILLIAGSFDQFRSEQHLSERSSKVEQLPFGAQQIMRAFLYTALPTQPLRTTPWVL
jgi:hypothetical protein